MLFVSLIFAFFFILSYSIFWSFKSQKYREFIILLSSCIFYASWSILFFFHLIFIIFINYILILKMKEEKKKLYLQIGIFINIINLSFFKYFYFFLDNIYFITDISIFNKQDLPFKIILPLAISFYTFQLIAFLVDVYKEKILKVPNVKEFFMFILFFPQLVAGPIMRYADFFPQLKNLKIKKSYIYAGLVFIITGVIKKALLADNIAYIIDPIWKNPKNYDALSLVLACYGFSLQVYCDFSGYSDIAKGCAFLLGFNIPKNFNAPFFTKTVSEFWRKWHVTLSSWLRDYIFIPLGGSRSSRSRIYFNLIVTFTLGGLWHGANWTFIFWGAFFGIILSLERILEEKKISICPKNYFGSSIKIFVVFSLFSFGFIFFRANSISDSFIILSKVFTLGPGTSKLDFSLLFPYFIFCFGIQYLEKYDHFPRFFIRWKNSILIISSIFLFILLGLYSGLGKEFIYFQF